MKQDTKITSKLDFVNLGFEEKKPIFKITPGPWKVDPECPTVIIDDSHNPRTVALVSPSSCSGNSAIGEANAHLIAAAPDLLAALNAVYAEVESWHRMHGHTEADVHCDSLCALMPQMQIAIRKAEDK